MAESTCKDYDGHLVSIESKEAAAYITTRYIVATMSKRSADAPPVCRCNESNGDVTGRVGELFSIEIFCP